MGKARPRQLLADLFIFNTGVANSFVVSIRMDLAGHAASIAFSITGCGPLKKLFSGPAIGRDQCFFKRTVAAVFHSSLQSCVWNLPGVKRRCRKVKNQFAAKILPGPPVEFQLHVAHGGFPAREGTGSNQELPAGSVKSLRP